MRTLHWTLDRPAADQLRELAVAARSPGILVVGFQDVPAGGVVSWTDLEPWTRSRAVTVADIAGGIGGAAFAMLIRTNAEDVREDHLSARLQFVLLVVGWSLLVWGMSGARGPRLRVLRGRPVVYDVQDLWPDTLRATGMIGNPRLLRLVSAVCDWVYRRVDRIVRPPVGADSRR